MKLKIGFMGLAGHSVFLSVPRFPAEGETVSASQLYEEPGGKAFNQAVAAARLGAECLFLGAFGRDAEAARCLDFLKNEGVSAHPVYKDKPTARACILTDAEGENRVTVYRGAAALLTDSDVENAAAGIAGLALLVLQNEVSASANLKACEIARMRGVPVLINPAPADSFEKELLRYASVITPNSCEAEALFGKDLKAGLEREGVRRAVVTLGSRGAVLYENARLTPIPAEKTAVCDTTGAGDCFTAALAVRLAEGASLIEAARFASKAAAAAVGRRCAVAAMPQRGEIK